MLVRPWPYQPDRLLRHWPIEIQRQQPSLSLHFFLVICILIRTFSYSGGGSQKTKANYPLVHRASLMLLASDLSKAGLYDQRFY